MASHTNTIQPHPLSVRLYSYSFQISHILTNIHCSKTSYALFYGCLQKNSTCLFLAKHFTTCLLQQKKNNILGHPQCEHLPLVSFWATISEQYYLWRHVEEFNSATWLLCQETKHLWSIWLEYRHALSTNTYIMNEFPIPLSPCFYEDAPPPTHPLLPHCPRIPLHWGTEP